MSGKKLSIALPSALVWLLAGVVLVAVEGRGLAQQDAGKLLFFDAFEYEVKRDVRDPRPAFLTQGKWSGVKSINSVGKGAGYLYTVDRIPGYTGKFPGRDSTRVLAIEGRPGTFQTQTDFYLKLGDARGPADQIPGDVWFQFWIYLNHYDDPEDKEDQLSGITGGKWLYPSPDGFYPTHPRWLFTINHSSHVWWPKRDEKPRSYEAPSYHEILIQTEGLGPGKPPVPFANIKKAPEWDRWKMGQTNIDTRIVANRWFLVKLHFDTSTTSGRYEAWLQPLGGKMVKVAEYIDGVTPDFSWTIPKEHVGGHKTVCMPTTLGSFTPERAKNNKDCWIYLDDFAMATSEDKLPTYSESK